ncbi:MAG TPA: adenine methyltransferase [Lentisphaeria bacterium]|nr:MAG: hypothetical protein A2X48_14630 [Lentisphaerae bacterium GWF2_49_21]HBC89561.1 adenine methyltransferase [Lentisphaeria bacterium]
MKRSKSRTTRRDKFKACFSSRSNLWTTPPDLFKKLDAKYHFNLDPCCTHETALCKDHFTPAEDGLQQSWAFKCVFCNPPYSWEGGLWVAKAYFEAKENGALVICLLPVRTDTRWFHEFVLKAEETEFIKGRLKFGNSKNSAPFPSIIVRFGCDCGSCCELRGKGEL